MSDPFNPYAAPSAASGDVSISAGYGQPMPWTPSEVLGAAWKRFNTSWLVMVGAYFVAVLASDFVSYGMQAVIYVGNLQKSALGSILYGVSLLASFCISSFFVVGLLRLFLDSARNRPLRFGVLFGGGDRWLAMLGLQFLVSLAVGIGFVLLIVPGVILALGFSLAYCYVVDTNMGPVDAMRASWEATKGQRGQLFVLSLLLVAVALAGLAACCIGILAAIPLTSLAWVIAYTRISGRDPAV